MAENHREYYNYHRRNGERPASTGMYYSAQWESKLGELVVSHVYYSINTDFYTKLCHSMTP